MRHLLVVEHDHDIGEMLQFALEDAGYRVTKTLWALVALDILRTQVIDLLLIDASLPDVPVDVFVHGIHVEPVWTSIPILILGGHADLTCRKPMQSFTSPFALRRSSTRLRRHLWRLLTDNAHTLSPVVMCNVKYCT